MPASSVGRQDQASSTYDVEFSDCLANLSPPKLPPSHFPSRMSKHRHPVAPSSIPFRPFAVSTVARASSSASRGPASAPRPSTSSSSSRQELSSSTSSSTSQYYSSSHQTSSSASHMHHLPNPSQLPTPLLSSDTYVLDDYPDGYLKHITFHEARREAQKPLRDAQAFATSLKRQLQYERSALVDQVSDLVVRFRRHRLQTALRSCVKNAEWKNLRRFVARRFQQWAARCGLDYVSRESKLHRVPRLLLAWKNRKVSVAFKHWSYLSRLLSDQLKTRRTRNLVLRLILHSVSKKVLRRAFSRMLCYVPPPEQVTRPKPSVNKKSVAAPKSSKPTKTQADDKEYYGDIWTEIPPQPFL